MSKEEQFLDVFEFVPALKRAKSIAEDGKVIRFTQGRGKWSLTMKSTDGAYTYVYSGSIKPSADWLEEQLAGAIR